MRPLFKPCAVPYGDKCGRGVAIVCGRCNHQHRIHLNSVKGWRENSEQDEKLATRKFEELGWRIGKSTGQHRCPDCIKEARHAQMRAIHAKKDEAEMKNVVELKTDKPAEPPREMTRADRRVIFAKLEETYGNDSYKPGWTDQKLAGDLGTQVAWVAQVREENFGPTGSNPQIDALLAEARAWRSDIVALVATADEINARFKALAAQGEAIERQVAEIKAQVGLS